MAEVLSASLDGDVDAAVLAAVVVAGAGEVELVVRPVGVAVEARVAVVADVVVEVV